jgi:anthranilate/para-aminobenzoate synthase component I
VPTCSPGAGIVADSDPQREYEETLHKAEALHRALELAAGMHSEAGAVAS